MASNTYHDLNPAALAVFAQNMKDAILANPAYGIPAGTTTALQTAIDALKTAIEAADAARSAFHASVVTKDTNNTTVVNQVAAIAKTLYANAAITGTMFANAGLAVHDTEPTPVTPVQPLNLTATPSWDGSVALKWFRNGNPQGVGFLIEGSSDGSTWNVLTTTTKAGASVSGFTPGAAFRFRIRATKNEITTLPSNEAVIYPSGGEALSIAA